MCERFKKAVSAVVAAALACSMVPLCAFAAEQEGATVPVAKAQQVRDAAQISIDAPASLDFASAGALIIQEKDTWAQLRTAASFQNRSDADIYISGVTVEQPSGSQLTNLYSAGSVAMRLVGQSGDATAAVAVGSSSAVPFTMPEDPTKSFTIAQNGNASFSLVMDGQSATLQGDDALKAKAEQGGAVKLASVVWTFAAEVEDIPGDVEEAGGFFLKDIPTDTKYSVNEVKSHAEDISAKGSGSPWFNIYMEYAKGTREYEAYVDLPEFVGTPVIWEVLVVGVNHDVKSDGSGRAGLTFFTYSSGDGIFRGRYFRFLIPDRDKDINYSFIQMGQGWQNCLARDQGQHSIYNNSTYDKLSSDLKGAIEQVKKSTRTKGGVVETDDYLFVISATEAGYKGDTGENASAYECDLASALQKIGSDYFTSINTRTYSKEWVGDSQLFHSNYLLDRAKGWREGGESDGTYNTVFSSYPARPEIAPSALGCSIQYMFCF